MKHIILTTIILISSLFLWQTSKAQDVTNKGILQVQPGTEIFIPANFTNDASGVTVNEGTIEVQGDWANNGDYSSGTVILSGADQLITGSVSTTFYNLTLSGTGIKSLDLDATIFGTLALNDREFATSTNIVSSFGMFSNTTGFISSLQGGGVNLTTAGTSSWMVPLGSSLGTLRYRPLTINTTTPSGNTFELRLANVNATSEGYDLAVKDSSLSFINTDYYHLIKRIQGTGPLDITISYDKTLDGDFQTLAHWQNQPRWEPTGNVTIVDNSPALSTMTISGWTEFTYSPFAFATKTDTVALTVIDSILCDDQNTTTFTASIGFDTYDFHLNGSSLSSGPSNSFFLDAIIDGDVVHVVATDSVGGINVSNEITLSVISVVKPDLGADTSVCLGNTVLLDAGSGFDSYLWSGSETSQTVVAGITGDYSVTVTTSGCSNSDSINLTINPNPIVDLGPDTTICEGESVLLDAGSHDSYLWGDNSSGQTFSASSNAIYSVTVSNTFGCTDSDTAEVTVNSTPVIDLGTDQMICAGGTLILDAGVGFDSYLWSTSESTQTIEVSTSGIYSVLIGLNNCYSSDTTEVTFSPSSIITDITASDVSCSGMSDGAASLSASGGAPPLTYIWSTGESSTIASNLDIGYHYVTVTDANDCYVVDSILISNSGDIISTNISGTNLNCQNGNDGAAILTASGGSEPYTYLWSHDESTSIVTGLSSGTYYVTVYDTVGCNAIDSLTISFYGDSIFSSISGTDASCSGANDGAASVAVSGGTAPYTYLWSAGSTSSIATNLSAGNYNVIVTDAAGCTLIDNIIVNISGSVIGLNIESNDASCGGASDGAAGLTTSGGISPFTYLWSNGGTSSIITGLATGPYSVTVTDATGCTAAENTTINEQNISFNISITTTDASCGTNDGTASATVSGGTPPYNFTWSTGDNTATADSLFSGMYMLSVTDDNTCSDFTVVTVNDEAGAEISISNITNVSCFGGSDGEIDIAVTGGAAPYTYDWSTGAITQDISNLTAGPYEINVIDDNNCVSFTSIAVSQPDAIVAESSANDATCNMNDGSISITVTGGTAPYTFQWETGGTGSSESNLTAGTYNVIITDVNGCLIASCASVSDNGSAIIDVDMIADATCGGGGGSVFINVSGGSSPFTYLWSDGSDTEDLIGVAPGGYNVSVTGSDGCVSTLNATVKGAHPESNPICLVTVDSIYNQIIWEKEQVDNIAYYNIYKESTVAGLYTIVAAVPYDDMSNYTDSLSNPKVKSWRYKISAVDTCGNESDYSNIHKTIHLTINQGLGDSYNLIWDNYEGFEFYTYYIHRYTAANGWEILDSVASTAFTYTDYPSFVDEQIFYQVSIDKDYDCYTTSTDKAQGGPYSQSFSNLDDNGIDIGIHEVMTSGSISIYPNPNKGRFTIQIDVDKAMDLDLEIFNAQGQALLRKSINSSLQVKRELIDLSMHPNGIYFVRLSGDSFSKSGKIIVQ